MRDERPEDGMKNALKAWAFTALVCAPVVFGLEFTDLGGTAKMLIGFAVGSLSMGYALSRWEI